MPVYYFVMAVNNEPDNGPGKYTKKEDDIITVRNKVSIGEEKK